MVDGFGDLFGDGLGEIGRQVEAGGKGVCQVGEAGFDGVVQGLAGFEGAGGLEELVYGRYHFPILNLTNDVICLCHRFQNGF